MMEKNGPLRDGTIMIKVQLRSNRKKDPATIDALVDTGAAMSSIPEDMALRLGIDAISEKRRSLVTTSGKYEAPAYKIWFEFGTYKKESAVFTGSRNDMPWIIIGRTILKDWDIEYNGPQQSYRILLNPEDKSDNGKGTCQSP